MSMRNAHCCSTHDESVKLTFVNFYSCQIRGRLQFFVQDGAKLLSYFRGMQNETAHYGDGAVRTSFNTLSRTLHI